MKAINNFRIVAACGRMSVWLLALAVCAGTALVPDQARAQSFSNFDPGFGRMALGVIKGALKKQYYDPAFHGMDLEARFKEAEQKLKQAESTSQIFGIIAQALVDLDDSHTFFVPPSRASRTDYGWQMQMIGDGCYVVAVKPGSDAETKGLKVGDRVQQVDGYVPTRDIFWKMGYFYYTLRPQPGMHLVVRSPGGAPRELAVMARIESGQALFTLGGGSDSDFWKLIRESESEDQLHRHRFHERGREMLIWKMPAFELDAVEKTAPRLQKFAALILDLRGNPGGGVTALERLVGYLFDQDIRIADRKGRKQMKPMLARTAGKRSFGGRLAVLVDSRSGSAAELLARLVQLEKRGSVFGDRTAGAVMQSRYESYQLGAGRVFYYGLSITEADLIMSNGRSLEHVGVEPDEQILPSAEDLAAGRDPALARAAALLGVALEPEEAGALFPIEWRK